MWSVELITKTHAMSPPRQATTDPPTPVLPNRGRQGRMVAKPRPARASFGTHADPNAVVSAVQLEARGAKTALLMGSLETASGLIGKRLEAEARKRQQAFDMKNACDEMEACVAESRRALFLAMEQQRQFGEDKVSTEHIGELEAELASAEADASCARENVERYQALDASVKKYLMAQQERQLPRSGPRHPGMLQKAAFAQQLKGKPSNEAVAPPTTTNRHGKKANSPAKRSARASTGRKVPRQPGWAADREFINRKQAEADKREKLRKSVEQRARLQVARVSPGPPTDIS